jgi:C-terminal processing protease CtpA/Prc
MKAFRYFSTLIILTAVTLTGCAGVAQTPTPTPQPPAVYLESALEWLQTYAVMGKNVDWNSVRSEALALNPNPQTTASTYPAICLALRSLKDGNASIEVSQPPDNYTGYYTTYPENNLIIGVVPGSAADQAGVQVGDVIEALNGAPPKSLTGRLGPTCDPQGDAQSPQDKLSLRHPGQDALIQVTINKGPNPAVVLGPSPQTVSKRLNIGAKGIGYLELAFEYAGRTDYVGDVQQQIKKLDQSPTCGWILDLRRITGGDIWSYLAAIGPILGEGDLGGFVYPDGRRELWAYRNGGVTWDGYYRGESYIDGPVYQLKQGMAPVALLTGPNTIAAGELLVVAFQGRSGVRTFGEATRGLPTSTESTQLSDGATIFVSGAFSFDRNGKTYSGPIPPDVNINTNWPLFATAQDPVILAAQDWLQSQPACKP